MTIQFKPGIRQSTPGDIVQAALKTAESLDSIPKRREKKGKTPTYNFTMEQIHAMTKQATDKATKEAVKALIELTLGLPVMVMRDKHKWGKKRAGQLVDDIMELYNEYEAGDFTLEDVREVLWEEAGIRITAKD